MNLNLKYNIYESLKEYSWHMEKKIYLIIVLKVEWI